MNTTNPTDDYRRHAVGAGYSPEYVEQLRARIAELEAELEAAKEKAWMYDELCK